MDFLFATLPYLNIGFFCALLARFTGANLSALVLCCFLYLGATPMQTIGMMLTFLAFMQLTIHTQGERLNFKTLRIFKGWRILIPVLFVAFTLVANPFYAIASFVGFFLMEVLAMLYLELPVDQRPTRMTLVKYSVFGFIPALLGLLALSVIPASYYYLICGILILIVSGLIFWLGKNRKRLQGTWDAVIYAAWFLLGFCGLEWSDWLRDLKRQRVSTLARYLAIVTVPVVFLTFVAANVLYGIISLSGLITALAATIAIRLFGYYQVSERGEANPIALGLVVLAVLCLFLVQPAPHGITDLLYVPTSWKLW